MSYRAKGVLLRLLSNEDGFRMTALDLANAGLEGREAILTALRELRVCGYVVVRRIQSDGGRWRTETYVYDTPQPTEVGFPDSGSPDSGSPDAGWPDPIQKNQQNNQQKVAAAPRASAEPAVQNADAAAQVDSIQDPSRLPRGEGKRRRVRTSGLLTWTPDDEAEAEKIESSQIADDIAAAVAAIKAAGKQPVPGLVGREIERRTAKRAAEERHAHQLAASAQQVNTSTTPSNMRNTLSNRNARMAELRAALHQPPQRE